MTIRKGSPWGTAAPLPEGAPIVDSDSELAAWWVAHHGEPTPLVVGLTGGDLHRALGAPNSDRMHGSDAWSFPLDLMAITLDGQQRWGAAHVHVGSRVLFRGPTAIVMNAASIGDSNLGPRAHPNDGLLDITTGRLGLWDRRHARSRMGHGAHLPHPGLTARRVPRWELDSPRPLPVRVDGHNLGRGRHIVVEVIPDAVVVVV